ncbi:MAG: M24 family metallopeptidase [Mycobacteriales bacterium]
MPEAAPNATHATLHAARRDALRAQLAELAADAALITRLVNVRYLTGFTGSNGALLLGADGDDLLATDGRYLIQAARQAPDLPVHEGRAVGAELAGKAAERGTGTLAYESHDVTVDGLVALQAAAEKVTLIKLGHRVEQLREVKDDVELELLREACAIGDRALADLIAAGGLRSGRTEKEIARDLEWRMFDHGADALSFATIVASGPNSAIPHHSPTDRVVGGGEFVKLDFGAAYRGYHSDMTRTVMVGQPADWQAELYAFVAEAQRVGLDATRPGVESRHVDRIVRDWIQENGHGELQHGLGHGVGLEVHELPGLGKTGTSTLAQRMAVTVEPGVYLEGRGGVRIEDTLVVRDGEPDILTLTTKDLLVL